MVVIHPTRLFHFMEDMTMPHNIGAIDRALRVMLGLVLLSGVFIGPQTPWGWIGILPLATALIGWCPAYTLLGINSCKLK
jgi:hypothetical protein